MYCLKQVTSCLNFYKHFQRKKKELLASIIIIIITRCLTCSMKPSHCLTRKCQKPNQLLKFWIAFLGVTLEKYHQHWVTTYWHFFFPKMLHFCIQNTRPWFVFVTLVWSTIFCVCQVIKSNWNKQVCSLSTIFIEAFAKLYMIRTPF